MALYRLDYEDGRPVENSIGRDFICAHMQTARERAIQQAMLEQLSITVTRIGKSGRLRPTLLVMPDGACVPPEAMRPEGCKYPEVCFCANCRARRKSNR